MAAITPRGETARRFARLENRNQWRLAALLAPAVAFLLVFYGYPVAAMLLRAFTDPDPGWQNLAPLVTARSQIEVLWFSIPSNAYLRVLGITIQIALIVTIVTLFLGYPVAYLLSALSTTRANLLMIFVLIPFWTSILIRSYAWMVLLGKEGVVNTILMNIGWASEPLQLLHTRFAVYVGMVHILLPFMILPLYSVMRGIDRNLIRAAENLGAPPFQAFRLVFLPLSLPGLGAGCLVVFILSLGFYITPVLLGGQRDVMISMLIQQQVTQLNWGFGASLALVLLVVSIAVYLLFSRMLGVQKLYGGAR